MNLDDSVYVIDAVATPELHLHTGIVNNLHDILDDTMKGADNSTVTASAWSDQLNVTGDGQGGSFNGNSCKKLLSNIESLEQILSDKK